MMIIEQRKVQRLEKYHLLCYILRDLFCLTSYFAIAIFCSALLKIEDDYFIAKAYLYPYFNLFHFDVKSFLSSL